MNSHWLFIGFSMLVSAAVDISLGAFKKLFRVGVHDILYLCIGEMKLSSNTLECTELLVDHKSNIRLIAFYHMCIAGNITVKTAGDDVLVPAGLVSNTVHSHSSDRKVRAKHQSLCTYCIDTSLYSIIAYVCGEIEHHILGVLQHLKCVAHILL